jgi:hypothetical protein
VSINDIRLSRECVKKAVRYLREIFRHRIGKTRVISLNSHTGRVDHGQGRACGSGGAAIRLAREGPSSGPITHAVNCYRPAESPRRCYLLPPYVSVNKHHHGATAYF